MDLSISKRNKINLGLESISGHMTLNQIIQSVKPAVSKLGKFTKPIVVSDFDELKKIVSGDLPRDYIQFMVSVGSMGNENLLGHPEWALKVITDMQKNATYWNLSWLPINEDGFGNYLVIDTAGVSGTKGAVLDCHHEKQWGNNNHPPKKFNSFIDFLNSDLFKVPYLDWMRTNKIIVSLESIDTAQLVGSQGIFSLDFIARQAYQAVQQLAVDMGQPQTIPWESASTATQESTKAGVLFYIQNPTATAEQVHESWMARKASEGWSCGDAKDETNKTHPCMRPYGELDIQHKLKDHIFMYVVNAFIEAYGEEATSKISVGEPNADWYENTMPGIEGFFDFMFGGKTNHVVSKNIWEFKRDALKQLSLTYGNAEWLSTANLVTTPIKLTDSEVKQLAIVNQLPKDLSKAVEDLVRFYSGTLKEWHKLEINLYTKLQALYEKLKSEKKSLGEILTAIKTTYKTEFEATLNKVKVPDNLMGNPYVSVSKNDYSFTTIKFKSGTVADKSLQLDSAQINNLVQQFTKLIKVGAELDNLEYDRNGVSGEDEHEHWDVSNLDSKDEELFHRIMHYVVDVEFQNFDLVNPCLENLNHICKALDSLLFKLIKPTMKVPGVESDFTPIVRYAGVETYYNTTMDLDLDEPTPGVEGIGDIFSSIGKWFRNINAEKVDGNVNALLSPETVKMINSTIRSPKWRKEQELKRGKISSPRVAPMLGLPGKFKSGDFLNNIKDSESKLKSLLPGYLKAISEHSDAIVAINKKAKVDWGQAKDSDTKIEIIKQALAAIRALEHPTTYYAKMKVETIGCIIPFTVNGEAGWKRNQDVDFPKEVDALTPEQFNAACDRFIEIYDEFKQPTSEFFDKIISAAEYVPVSTGGPFWDLIKKETNGGKLYLNYGLSCVTSKQVESLVYDSVFALWYQFSLRGLIAWIGSSVH